METELQKAKRLIQELLSALQIAEDRSQSDLYGIYHNQITDSMIEADEFLKEL
jgi:hypothetical protein